MSKQEILDKYWVEFIDFYRQLTKEAKEQELDVGEGDFSKIMGLMLDKDKLSATAVYMEFKDPTETNFWKWYALVKTKPTEAQEVRNEKS